MEDSIVKSMARRASLGLMLALAGTVVLAPAAQAQQKRVYIFAWAYERQSNNLYISDSVATAPSASYDKGEVAARWRSALLRQGISGTSLSATDVGTPNAIDYPVARDADDARNEFAIRERKRGKNVIWVSW